MGTRADFWVGRGKDAEWLGSIAYDGYALDELAEAHPNTPPFADEAAFRRQIAVMIAVRRDGTKPEQGWPWPWDDSRTTDYAYAWDDGVLWCSVFGRAWYRCGEKRPEGYYDGPKTAVFPDMSARKNVAYDDRSGALFLGLK